MEHLSENSIENKLDISSLRKNSTIEISIKPMSPKPICQQEQH